MPSSFEERHPEYDPNKIEETKVDELIEEETDEEGRIEQPKELEPLEVESERTTTSLFVKLNIVADEQRAAALASILRGKTPASVIKKRPGKGGKEFSYVPGWYVKKMLNSLFALQWDFEIVPIKEGELFHLNSKQVVVMGKLTIRDTGGSPRIIKMAVGKKELAYPKAVDGKMSTTPIDLGNDIKAAETDALKRAATGLGIALDLYQGE